MPNDEFTRNFIATAETAQSVTNGILISNFFINLLLSGSMTLLWGMLNCMQIVAHFYLVNIMFPANVLQLFKILVSTANFDILPTQVVIDEIEELLGIKNDNYILTDSFVDFEYDSSAPIHNLQIMFLAMVILAAIPLLLIALRGILFWSNKVQRGVN